MKKLLKVTALSATAFTLLGTSMVSAAEEVTGEATVTYEPGIVSATDAAWAISMPKSVILSDSNIASNKTSTDVASVGQDLSFSVFDTALGESSHSGNQNITVTLETSITDSEIALTKTSGQGADEVKIALAKSSNGTTYDSLIDSNSSNNIGTLTNNTSGNTITLKAAITDAGSGIQKGDKYGTTLTFKFSNNG